ncbi:MAG: hypothetical protein M1837_002889 [Sclerophora amabilis]|nr:MAG: hypothetical protein M1837_002889 [Sclerophora amabilis]
MASTSYYNDHTLSPTKFSPTSDVSSIQTPTKYQYNEVPHEAVEEQTGQGAVKDSKLKRNIRILRVVFRVLNAIVALAITGIMAAVLGKFLATRDVIIDGRNAWAKDTKLWPSIMLFAIAGVSLILNVAILLSYKRSVKAANKAAMISAVFTGLEWTAEVVVWCLAASLYRYGKDTDGKSNDLWGWACSQGAAKIQEKFDDVVQFKPYCDVQVRPPFWCPSSHANGIG